MKKQNEFEKRPYISAILILLAFCTLSISWMLIMALGIIYYAIKDKLTTYLYNVGVSVDYLLATLLFATKGHTISAIVYKRGYMRAVKVINWLFRDSLHCQDSYRKEYIRDG